MPTTEQLASGPVAVYTPEEAKAAMDRGEIVLIDVRTPAEYAFEHIRGALLCPLSSLEPATLPGQEGKSIVFHCGSGVRSKMVAEKVLAAGLGPVAHMEGGFGAWKKAGLPFITTDPASGAPREVVMG